MHVRNIFWNLLGLGLPLLIAVVTVPNLIARIGTERFGFLALAWGLIGYAGALDLGVGRAVTQRVSAIRGYAQESDIPDVIATAVKITATIGLAGLVLIALGGVFGGYDLIPRNTVSKNEVIISILLLAVAIPMQAISATYRGVNEAYLNFKSISILRMFLGAANFGGPFLVALYTDKLYWVVATLVLSRSIALIAYRHFAYKCLPERLLVQPGQYKKEQAKKLLEFGGWVTVSSIVSPFLVQADRFFVGALITAAAVTTYVIPYEITVQSMILVGAITTVAFPMISNLINSDPEKAKSVFDKWLVRVVIVMFCAMCVLAFIMPFILNLWVKDYVAPESVMVGRILCLGVFFNAIGAMYYSYLHAHGRTKITAIFHVVELPIFVGLLYVFIIAYGVVGAAVAWSLRVFIDAVCLYVGSHYATKYLSVERDSDVSG
ncbi:flippase [Pseudomonas sp. WS 5071]|uniref:oligosaccharide flippase family protein n=1 Tax=Pseudomonas sp. WS 5071 TaxID=2717479 RepID=UPI001472A81A|nr:flippase [Pseudomonas sp. WS 5071]